MIRFEVISINQYMTATSEITAYLPYPRFLLTADLTLTARLVYTLLLDRTTLSQKNDWVDEAGHIYVFFTLSALSEALKRSTMTIKKALNELESADLIERKRHGFSAPNRIFVKLPSYGKKTDCMMDSNLSIIEQENGLSFGKKTDHAMETKLSPNYLSINNLRNNNLSRAIAENPPTLYGRFENVKLTETELSTLQTELPAQWQGYIERLSEYMASTGKRYQNHLATMQLWARKDIEKTTQQRYQRDYSVEEGETV